MTTPSLSSGDLTAADSGAGGENAPVCLLTVAPRCQISSVSVAMYISCCEAAQGLGGVSWTEAASGLPVGACNVLATALWTDAAGAACSVSGCAGRQ